MRGRLFGCLLIVLSGCAARRLAAADWPQFRYDAARSAASPESLADPLYLQWIRELPAPQPAFPHESRLAFDRSYEPVVLGERMFVPSMVTDSVTALDIQTGNVLWQFFADGPVRFAPVAWRDRVYFVSDDGYLYCLRAEDGKLLWRFRGLPADREDRLVLGNGRLISLRPARGGPVLNDGVIYFAAGIWADEGIFVHALDAESGRVIWSNTDSGQIVEANVDHGIKSPAGLSPQGYLALVDDRLIVPCGTQLPALLDSKTGRRELYTMGWGGRGGVPKGSWWVAGSGRYLLTSGDLYDIRRPNEERFREPWGEDFKRLLYAGGYTRLQIDPTNQRGLGEFREPVITEAAMYFGSPLEGIVGYDLTRPTIERTGEVPQPAFRQSDKFPDQWTARFPELFRVLADRKVQLLAGSRLIISGPNEIAAVDLPPAGGEARIGWGYRIKGTPTRALAAGGRLFVVTQEGRIYAFGETRCNKPYIHQLRPPIAASDPARSVSESASFSAGESESAARILSATGCSSGYALVLGLDQGRVAEQLVLRSELSVIALDPDADKVSHLRQRWHDAGLYGRRITAQVADPWTHPLPPLIANLIVSERSRAPDGVPADIFVKRIYRLLRPYGGTACLAPPLLDFEALPTVVKGNLPGCVLRRGGEFGLLSRNGPLPGAGSWTHEGADAANTGASDEHGLNGPLKILWFGGTERWLRMPGGATIRVAGGRMFLLNDRLVALDVFTGRRLWEYRLPPTRYLPSQEMVVVDDAVYVPHERSCLVLDPETGSSKASIEIPAELAGRTRAGWSRICIGGEVLVGAVGKTVIAAHRRDGRLLWQRPCEYAPQSLAIGGGRVYCAIAPRLGWDALTTGDGTAACTVALDLTSGECLWQIDEATAVRYSATHDLLVTSRGIYRGRDGTLVRGLEDPSFLAGSTLVSETPEFLTACDLVTGQESLESVTWNRRGCTTLRASASMVTTRYGGNAAWIDLDDGQITPLGNVRAGCSNNLIPADGLLNIPDVTGGCDCNYLPTSFALAPGQLFKVP